MDVNQELKNTLSYINTELNRIETMAGTLSTIEREHYTTLTNFNDNQLMDIALEEQNASRQLGTIKHMCLSLNQKIEELMKEMERGERGEGVKGAKTH